MSAKLLQTTAHHHCQMRLAVLVTDIDRFFDAIILKRLSNARCKLARLLFRGRIRQVAFDHDRD
jgi:hypothetical protein